MSFFPIRPLRWRRLWMRSIAQSDAFERLIARANLQRLIWAVRVVIPLNLVHVLVFWYFPPTGRAPLAEDWARWLGGIHLAMAMGLLALLLPLQRARDNRFPGPWPVHLNTGIAWLALMFSAGVASIDQWVTPNITPFLMGALLVSSLMALRPSRAIPVYVCGLVFYWLAIGWTQTEQTLLISNRVNGLTVVAVSLVISITSWRRNTETWLLRRKLERQHSMLQSSNQRLQILASHDRLTGLLNREAFIRLATDELARARRYGHECSLIVADLDFFKRVNDTYGHPAGDTVLKTAAEVMQRHLRSTDMLGRLGGEEFIVLLPYASIEEAALVASKIRMMIEDTGFWLAPAGVTIHVTISLGVDGLHWNGHQDFADLYAGADAALYEAKQAGRNLVVIASPLKTGTPATNEPGRPAREQRAA